MLSETERGLARVLRVPRMTKRLINEQPTEVSISVTRYDKGLSSRLLRRVATTTIAWFASRQNVESTPPSTHTHTHTHTQLNRGRLFLRKAMFIICRN